MTDVLELTRALISRASVTPEDGGCQTILAERLAALGFAVTHYDCEDVKNLWCTLGSGGPLVVLAGHTDVVPPGDLSEWHSPPFEPEERNGLLFGRGAADMKSSLAAMVVATERFLAEHTPSGTLAFLITSDEEGVALHGTRHVVAELERAGIQPDYCIVGEPSSSETLGDVVRNGRRGSLNGTLRVLGTQGHVAYPHLADNPVHAFGPLLTRLAAEVWDEGNDYYPPTSFQISNVNAGTGATNVIPGDLNVLFNFRFNTEQTVESLQQRFTALLEDAGLRYELDWQLSGLPFLTPVGVLTDAVQQAVGRVTGHACELSTSGGTSDGRFIAPMGCEVVELGPINATIHKLNEHVAISDLEPLARIYADILATLLGPGDA